MGLAPGVELPVVGPAEKVDLSISAPNKGGVRVGWDAWEALAEVFGVSRVRPLVLKLPVLTSLDEVGRPGGLPGEGGVNVGGQTPPVLVNLPGVAGSHAVLRQLPVVVSPEHVGAPVGRHHDGVHPGAGADVVPAGVEVGRQRSRLGDAGAGAAALLGSVQRADGSDVVCVEFEERVPATVERSHDGFPLV